MGDFNTVEKTSTFGDYDTSSRAEFVDDSFPSQDYLQYAPTEEEQKEVDEAAAKHFNSFIVKRVDGKIYQVWKGAGDHTIVACYYIPERVDFAGMFAGCDELRYICDLHISDHVASCHRMFYDCVNFNQPINIPEGIVDCSAMFCGCINYNQHVSIPKGVFNCSQMFCACENFNQSVDIPDGVLSCKQMFDGCFKFNRNYSVPYKK